MEKDGTFCMISPTSCFASGNAASVIRPGTADTVYPRGSGRSGTGLTRDAKFDLKESEYRGAGKSASFLRKQPPPSTKPSNPFLLSSHVQLTSTSPSLLHRDTPAIEPTTQDEAEQE